MSQRVQALQLANQTRWRRAEQRKKLQGQPLYQRVVAIIRPTPELGSYSLGTLLVGRPPLVQGVNKATFARILANLSRESWRVWRPQLRLDELTLRERRFLAKELLRASEKGWATLLRDEAK